MTEERELKPIEAPSSYPGRNVSRALMEGVAELVPGGGVVTGVLRVTHPPKSEQAREDWQKAISERTNEHGEQIERHAALLEPKISLSVGASQLAIALAKSPGDGIWGAYRNLDELCVMVPDLKREAVEDAAFELEDLGLVEMLRAISGPLQLLLTQAFYEQIDPQVMGWNPKSDAVRLAQLLIEEKERQRTAVLHADSGWEKRRFNPAFRCLIGMLTIVSKELQPHYPASSVSLLPEDRARLRRFIAAAGGE